MQQFVTGITIFFNYYKLQRAPLKRYFNLYCFKSQSTPKTFGLMNKNVFLNNEKCQNNKLSFQSFHFCFQMFCLLFQCCHVYAYFCIRYRCAVPLAPETIISHQRLNKRLQIEFFPRRSFQIKVVEYHKFQGPDGITSSLRGCQRGATSCSITTLA